ncbi:hypothetical protein ACLESO_34990 [Pyxidicoccus sp. 3LG]
MFRTAVLPLLAALALSGCGLPSSLERAFSTDDDGPPAEGSCDNVVCGPCAPAVTLRISGGPGQPSPEAALVGAEADCGTDASATVCMPRVFSPGDYTFQVEAPGYEKASVQVTVAESLVVGACCNCGYEPRVVDVTLHRR